jgi:glutathione peroxidase
MKRYTSLVMALTISLISAAQTSSIYDFKVKTIDGKDFDFSSLRGKKVIVVNTASKCGFTPQYESLQTLYEQFGQKLVIVGFPANNFLNQEPGTAEEIRQFCTDKYEVTFPLMEKISVKGKDMHPLYQWLTTKEKNGVLESSVKWNFQKYLIDENGKLVDVAYPAEKPDSDRIIAWLNSK